MNAIQYSSSGKLYCNEPAIISMTSWRKRIDTCGLTIFSLLKNCPGFHIVLVLSEEEFPLKERELPESLMSFVDNKFIELLWVYKNYRSFKKWIFTAYKYKDVAIISVDDDVIYTINIGQLLYDKWKLNQDKIICMKLYCHDDPNDNQVSYGNGSCGILYPPNCFTTLGIKCLNDHFEELVSNGDDDQYWGCLANKYNIKYLQCFENQICPFKYTRTSILTRMKYVNSPDNVKLFQKLFNDSKLNSF